MRDKQASCALGKWREGRQKVPAGSSKGATREGDRRPCFGIGHATFPSVEMPVLESCGLRCWRSRGADVGFRLHASPPQSTRSHLSSAPALFVRCWKKQCDAGTGADHLPSKSAVCALASAVFWGGFCAARSQLRPSILCRKRRGLHVWLQPGAWNVCYPSPQAMIIHASSRSYRKRQPARGLVPSLSNVCLPSPCYNGQTPKQPCNTGCWKYEYAFYPIDS